MRITRRSFAMAGAGAPFFAATSSLAQTPQAPDVSSVQPLVQSTYRYLHEHPEIGLQERLAHDRIVDVLQQLSGFDIQPMSSLPTAVIAVFETGRAGPCRALRAELDALEIQEPAGHDPRSTIDGMMHACGHDAHAAMLLGAAAYVKQNASEFSGRLVFVFQPSEEKPGGANDIVNAGILRDLGVDAIFAQHVAPGLPVGLITLTPGIAMAASYSFTLTIEGGGGHAAMPFLSEDLSVAAARLIEALAAFPARRLDIANRPVVISVTRFETDNTEVNVLPSRIALSGTIRALERLNDPPRGEQALGPMLEAYVGALARGLGVRHTSQWRAAHNKQRRTVRARG